MIPLDASVLMWVLLALFSANGVAHAETNFHDVVRDKEGQIVRNTFGNCVRTKWMSDHDACVLDSALQEANNVQRKPPRSAKLTQADQTVYFKFDSSVLQPEAKQRLDVVIAYHKPDLSVNKIDIIGYADRIGNESYNQRLSQRRAEAVRDYFAANGYANTRVTKTQWVGETKPSTNCAVDEQREELIECLHNDRRVEVNIVYRKDRKNK